VSVAYPSLAPAGSLSPGDLDTSFGSGANTLDVALQPDGKIVAAGFAGDSLGYNDFALARYTISGTLDTTFGSGN
jgi:hypothetical protein